MIDIQYTPVTYKLEDGEFRCQHNDIETVEYVEDSLRSGDHYQRTILGYACVECGEQMPGDPEEDEKEAVSESILMELLGK